MFLQCPPPPSPGIEVHSLNMFFQHNATIMAATLLGKIDEGHKISCFFGLDCKKGIENELKIK